MIVPVLAGLLIGSASLASAEHANPAVDARMESLMNTFHLAAGTVAVSMDERLVYAAGYNLDAAARLRIGSISKVFTALTIQALSQQGRLSLDSPVLSLLPETGVSPVDARWGRITVRQLLSHRGGFDPAVTGFDPLFPDYDSLEANGLPLPPEPLDVIRQMQRLPLAFDPGTREAYSNFGYLLLGQVIEAVSNQKYEDCVEATLFAPQHITRPKLGGALAADRLPGEPSYRDEEGASLVPSFYPPYGQAVPRPYGGTRASLIAAAGGWVAAAPDLVRLTSRLPAHLLGASIERPSWVPRSAPYWTGPAWTVIPANGGAALLHHGGLPGSRSVLLRMPLENGATGCVAILFAASPPESRDEEASLAMLTAAVEILQALSSSPGPDQSALFFPDGPAPFLEPYGVLHAATGSERIFAPGQIVDVEGLQFDDSLRVEVDGIPAEILDGTPTRIRAVLPDSLAPNRTALLRVFTRNGGSREVKLSVAESAPGLFQTVLNGDGSINSENTPATLGSWLLCFSTGLGAGEAELLVHDAPTAAVRVAVRPGLELVRFRIPASVSAAGPVPLRFRGEAGKGAQAFVK